jgi:HTH-type transcriptional regulator/antitoxin HigA
MVQTKPLIDSYTEFMSSAHSFLNIENETQYQATLTQLDGIFEMASDTLDDPLNPLIEMLSKAIDDYELKDNSVVEFVENARKEPTDIAVLRTLMSSYNLSGNDLPEIGGRSLVSKILNGHKTLTRQAIERVAERFDLRPSIFLD